MKQLNTWKFISSGLEKELDTVLLYVLESKGSSPGRQGFFMAINSDMDMCGSIGGGMMEHKFVELAKEKLKSGQTPGFIRKQVHSKSAAVNQSGMICSGEQTLFIYSFKKEDRETIKQIIDCLEQHNTGELHLSPNNIGFSKKIPDQSFNFNYQTDTDWQYKEQLGFKDYLYIVGGGHCALAFSKLMHGMDFYIHVFDDREGLNTMQQNEWAHEKTIVENYSGLAKYIPSGQHNYVVLMTFGYRTDAEALRALIQQEYKYIGLLGSAAKIKELMKEFKNEGISAEKLSAIHAPIGLDIKSETPEEIAVSIAAEIIKIKNRE